MEIITATLPSILEAKKHNQQEASEFISLPCFTSCVVQLSRASASWGPCGVGSLPCTPCLCCGWAWGCQQGQESERRARHGGGKGREIDYQLESAGYLYIHLSITTSDTTTFREQWPLLYFDLPNFTHVPLMANSKWNHTGKAMLGNSSHFNQLDRTQAICVVRKLLLGSEPWAET